MLDPGARFGPYEVLSLLGAGGMGEVYRARDTRLGRDVAIKVLPSSMAEDPERVARFQREAQVLASLSHPHIGAIFGLEEDRGTRFLVLELVEGGTLADRLAGGPLPVPDALELGQTIAKALQAAHDKGIIHRDLKPSNIAFTVTGEPKVLDFGLAKLGPDRIASPSASMSPTISSPVQMTGVGVILGTAAYMAPEQARGKPADKRSDLWSLGCVLYEMLAGRRAFDGEDVTETLANVLKTEPDWTALPDGTPAAVRVLLRRCLAKDPRQRVGDAAAVLVLIEEAVALQPHSHTGVVASGMGTSWARLGSLVAVLVAGVLVGAAAVWWTSRPSAATAEYTAIPLPRDMMPRLLGNDRTIAVTPDGKRIVYVGEDNRHVYVRKLEEPEPRILIELTSVRGLFVSRDGQWVGIVEAPNRLQKVPIDGGAPIPIVEMDDSSLGATWLGDDSIVFGTLSGTGLQQVRAMGGPVTVLTRPNVAGGERNHVAPQAVPGRDLVIFTILSASGNQVALLDLRSRQYTTLVRGAAQGRYLSSGHLLYQSGGAWVVAAFDLDKRAVTSPAVPLEDVDRTAAVVTGYGVRVPALVLDVSDNGSLVYLQGTSDGGRVPVAVGPNGRETVLHAPARAYQVPRISPDGRRVLFHEFSAQGELDVSILDLDRGTIDPVTTDAGRDSEPIWSPQGDRIAYFSTARPGGPGIFLRSADGTGEPERLTTGTHLPTVWSNDGWLAYIDFGDKPIASTTATSLMIVNVTGERTPRAASVPKTDNLGGRPSPAGNWVATVEATFSTDQLYVRPFSNPGSRRIRVSTDGGRDPVWSRDGKTLYFRNGQTVMSVDATGAAPEKWQPKKFAEGPYVFATGPTHFDVMPDGRLLLLKNARENAERQLLFVRNWFAALRALVPAN